jgi:hypothetical protein
VWSTTQSATYSIYSVSILVKKQKDEEEEGGGEEESIRNQAYMYGCKHVACT